MGPTPGSVTTEGVQNVCSPPASLVGWVQGGHPVQSQLCFSCNTMSLSLNQLWVRARLGLAVHLSVWSLAGVADYSSLYTPGAPDQPECHKQVVSSPPQVSCLRDASVPEFIVWWG